VVTVTSWEAPPGASPVTEPGSAVVGGAVSAAVGAVVVGATAVLGGVVVVVAIGCVTELLVLFDLRPWRAESVARIEVEMSDLFRTGVLPEPQAAHAKVITNNDRRAGTTCLEPDMVHSLLRYVEPIPFPWVHGLERSCELGNRPPAPGVSHHPTQIGSDLERGVIQIANGDQSPARVPSQMLETVERAEAPQTCNTSLITKVRNDPLVGRDRAFERLDDHIHTAVRPEGNDWCRHKDALRGAHVAYAERARKMRSPVEMKPLGVPK
jgi:hypothetical protein